MKVIKNFQRIACVAYGTFISNNSRFPVLDKQMGHARDKSIQILQIILNWIRNHSFKSDNTYLYLKAIPSNSAKTNCIRKPFLLFNMFKSDKYFSNRIRKPFIQIPHIRYTMERCSFFCLCRAYRWFFLTLLNIFLYCRKSKYQTIVSRIQQILFVNK